MIHAFVSRPYYEWSGYAILLFGFILCLIVQLRFYRRILVKMSAEKADQQERPISILLNVRNEAERIETFLMKLLAQNYSNFEVVVVDDFSADSTLIILGVLAKKYPQIKFSTLSQENRYSEKMAMNLALKAAKYDWVLFLSPEVQVEDPNYLKKLNQELNSDSQMLVSYLNYQAVELRFNRLCRVERLEAFWRASLSEIGSAPFVFQQMNVLFNKQIYFENSGFKGRMNAHYAGLELVFNAVPKLPVQFSIHPQTILRENRLTDKAEFSELIQKHIRLFSSLRLSQTWPVRLGLFAHLVLWASVAALLLTDPAYWFVFLPVPMILFGVHVVLIKSMLKRLDEKKIFLSSLLYVFVRPFLYLFHRATIYLQVQRNKWN
ncbi:glycosyl transferase family 2 [Mangrovibacterium marinum]|uniref:Glycosyl transferase family 2 n=1 Tax=Mangrovibacterium marinum TaxID=1639118 RepID=A0A2T5C1A2_9BACT|nr:glycosyltransferase [Mangrovibacterium marinum]PTN08397.1 glycosyl transferase family 2 [Mangrovibacterium marinum]